MMKTSDEGLELIKQFEGLRLEPYRCSAGVLTIGYGHTHNVKHTDIITKIKAEQYLREDVAHAEDVVNSSVRVELNQHQYDALIDFVFNLGGRNFKKSTLLKKINNRKSNDEICIEFRKWDKCSITKIINGQRVVVKESLPGLTKRRDAEVHLWLKH